MKTRAGYIQGYNAQAEVDREQIILAAYVTQQELKAAGIEEEIKSELAGAGHWSEGNVVESSPTDPEFMIATRRY